MFREIEVEAFGPGCAFDEPVEGLRRVRDLLRDDHHALLGTARGVGFTEDPGGSSEEVLAGKQLSGVVVWLGFWAHGGHYIKRRIKREKRIDSLRAAYYL